MISKLINTKLINSDAKQNKVFKPIFFDLNITNDEQAFIHLIESSTSVTIVDEIKSQLEELIKLRNPQVKFTQDELTKAINNHLNGVELYQYGIWVYYPWLNKLIHLLNQHEFIEVRTNRNQYKITPEEEELLSTKTIGIIGLSVGKSIALTIAMERICGELIIADFDVIELSNLNRIQTGVQNFGIKKTVVVAREIAEIDPFLKVTCLSDGLTEENMSDFFFPNGKKIDLCIEVCDGLSIKIVTRQKAKEYKIPVVMSTSDRGMTDVERFDKNENTEIFHGLLNGIDISSISKLVTNEEKAPIVRAILQEEAMSIELKNSMLEIGKTISTWPQLASCVTMGGGITCNVSRRLLLGEDINSGRYFIDLEQLIN
jgi:hypothetical protein